MLPILIQVILVIRKIVYSNFAYTKFKVFTFPTLFIGICFEFTNFFNSTTSMCSLMSKKPEERLLISHNKLDLKVLMEIRLSICLNSTENQSALKISQNWTERCHFSVKNKKKTKATTRGEIVGG